MELAGLDACDPGPYCVEMLALHQARGSQRLVLLLVTSLAVLLLTGCGPSAPTPAICAEATRTPLLKANLDPWTPSAPFTLPAGSVAWLQVTRLPASAEGLFGTVAGVAELHSIPSGATPSVVTQAKGDKQSQDPSIVVQKALTWRKLPLSPGAWQLYSASDPGIEVVSCVTVSS